MSIRADFPILDSSINGKKLCYLDSAATSQKPLCVIDSMYDFLKNHNATVRRGVYDLTSQATKSFDQAREKVRAFINAKSTNEIIITRGTTEAINLVAQSFCGALKGNLGLGSTQRSNNSPLRVAPDQEVEILISGLEHHANIVPWQINAHRIGATLKVIPVLDNGELDQDAYRQLISSGKVKLLALSHISNALGTINPIKEMIQIAHQNSVSVLIDGAQGITHSPVDVQDLDVDFYVFSGHKLYGPTGVGILYGKEALLNALPPYHGGGEMIDRVSFNETSFGDLPFKFEAGTPPIAELIGLGTAIDYINSIGMKRIIEIEKSLHDYCLSKLTEIEGLRIIGKAQHKASISSFVFDDIEAFDIGTMLNQHGIAIRTGHHCTQPLMQRFNVSGTSRVSIAFYNNEEDIDRFITALKSVVKMFR
jgi:cysteine desulfurase/selenocysteine lyase